MQINIGISWRGQWYPTPVLLPGKSHGWRSLVGYSPRSPKESDTTEWLHFHFSLSCLGEGNGNPLQCSCLENPRTGEPGGLLSMGSHRVGHDWSDLAAAAAYESAENLNWCKLCCPLFRVPFNYLLGIFSFLLSFFLFFFFFFNSRPLTKLIIAMKTG